MRAVPFFADPTHGLAHGKSMRNGITSDTYRTKKQMSIRK
jgi:hypothetical protein